MFSEVRTTSETQAAPVVLGVDVDSPLRARVLLYRLGHWSADMTPDEADTLAAVLTAAAQQCRQDMLKIDSGYEVRSRPGRMK